MQARRLFTSLLCLAAWLGAPAAPWAAPFDAQDLEGEWYGVALDVVDTENEPYLLEYAFTVDAGGEISGTVIAYFEVAPAEVFPILSGHFDITPAGAVGPADLNVALSDFFPVPELQMNEARDFMAGSGAAIATGRQINLFANLKLQREGPAKLLLFLAYVLTIRNESAYTRDELRTHERIGWDTNWDPDRVWLSDFRQKGDELSLKGTAVSHEDVSEFSKRLESGVFFPGVEPVSQVQAFNRELQISTVDFLLRSGVRFGRPKTGP